MAIPQISSLQTEIAVQYMIYIGVEILFWCKRKRFGFSSLVIFNLSPST